ncbi:antiviral innate immune response receptor RIG-I-like isoform X2 [Mercenaria mercenaria]|nr:antiviral innate immune response receptor RIG-I-like isoform X2 [Mercenaria mercenaria]XP_053406757.1 antiviral innate immune response receptor RIG-I-like isoform X2 [Mercenaria mercenaria]
MDSDDTSETNSDNSTADGTEKDDLDKIEFKNWIRGVKGLEYLQQGLAPFVDREVAIKHSHFMQSLKSKPKAYAKCNCTYENLLPNHAGGPCNRQNIRNCFCHKPSNRRRKCPNGICGKICDFIVQEHRFTNPSLRNSDISEWSNNAWSVAKCFIPDSKYPTDSARSTDAAGLLNIIINANFIQQKLTCNIDPPNDIMSQAREYRNELMHKAQWELTEQQLSNYLDHFISILQDPHTLAHDKDAVIAVNNLDMLKKDQIRIDKEEEKTLREKALQRLEEEKIKALDDIEASKCDALDSISSTKTEVLEELEKYEVDAKVLSEVKAKTDSHSSTIQILTDKLNRTEEQMKVLKTAKGVDVSGKEDRTGKDNEIIEEQSEGDNAEEVIPLIQTDDDYRKKVEVEPIELREYQMELATKGLEGSNVVVLAPTNTGKTRVACKIIQDHFQKRSQMGDFGKVIFLVHTEPLAFQQGKRCAEYLPNYRTKVITGRVQREKKHYLKDYIERRDILVVTAQVLLNSLKLKEISSLKDFSLIVIDECHHTIGSHSYNQIMNRHIEMKLRDNIGLPQIVGLTASLGVGGSTDERAAKEHMKSLMVNLDTNYLSTVKENLEQLHEYANKAKEYKEVARNRLYDRYREALLDIINDIDVYMANHDCMRLMTRDDEFIKELARVPLDRGSEQFSQWIGNLNDGIGRLQSDEVIRMMSPCRRHLEIYNKALMINADARMCDSMAILSEFMKAEKSGNETDEMLLNHYMRLTSQHFEDPGNPKLMKMEEILARHMVGKEARCIIFTKTIDLAMAITNWINEKESLRNLNAKEFLGRKKMSRLKQIDVLEYFRNGRHKVIVATSVAEEGLDVTACNLVIRYEHVKNEIVRLQSRGRARAKDSSYYVLTKEGSSLIQKEEELEIRERVMDRIIPDLRFYTEMNQHRWTQELKTMQEEKIATEQQRERTILANITPGVKHLHCYNCNSFICLTTDLRRFQLNHHIVIAEDVQKRLIFLRSPDPRYEEEDFKSDGNIMCDKCQVPIGGVFEFKKTEFPLIKIKRVRVIDRSINKGQVFKIWKKVNFRIEQISSTELERIVLVRDDYSY